jgi:hypothetical protein
MAPLLNNFSKPTGTFKKISLNNDFKKKNLDKIEEQSDCEANADIS